MKKRVVFKKGRFVVTRKGKVVIHLSKKIYLGLKPFCKKIEIVGSIRRKSEKPVDIDIVLIPKNKDKVIDFMKTKGKYLQGGEKRVTFKIEGVKIEIYFANSRDFGAMLMTYTGPFGSNIGLRSLAKRRGYLLNQYGLFDRKSGKKIAGKTEEGIYKALGKKWKKPEER